MTYRAFRRGGIITAMMLLLAVVVAVPSVRSSLVGVVYAASGRVIHYFNDDVFGDNIDNNDFNFGPNRKERADKAVENKEVTSVQEWVATREGTGDFFDSIDTDPALCAAVALHLDESLTLPEVILKDEQDVIIGQRADAAHKHFLDDQEYWDRAVELIKEYLTHSEIKIEKINKYTSAMYMWNNHLDGNKPSVIVRNTSNAGGHMIIFDLGKPGIVKFRLECGYQPVDIPYWPTPDKPSIPDNPDPDPDPDPQPDPDPDPNPDPDPDPNPEPDPDPVLEPKDPNDGPQGQVPDNPDFGGGPNHDNDTDLTPEPTSPDTYTPPKPPVNETPSTQEPNPDKPNRPNTSDGVPDASSGSNSGSHTIDKSDGTTVTLPNGTEYDVVAGDGEEHGDFNEIVDNEHSEDTVEPPVADDGVNEGDLDPDAVE